MTGPAKIPIELKLQSMPSRIPNSRTGEMAPQLAATSVIHAPLPKPYMIKPRTITASGRGLAIQKAKREMAEVRPERVYIFHTPNLSARTPESARPRNEPTWRIATA